LIPHLGEASSTLTSSQNEANQHTLSLFPELRDIFKFLPNYQVVNEGLVRGGQPEGRGYEILKEEGIRTVINIREESEALEHEGTTVRELGMTYLAHSVHPFKVPDDELLLSILADIVDEAMQPVFVHCLHGQDRTGTIVGIYRMLIENWNIQDTYTEMLAMGYHPAFTNLREALDRFDLNRVALKAALDNRLSARLAARKQQQQDQQNKTI
jgi:tyrosine-protein phosphatase SIW14